MGHSWISIAGWVILGLTCLFAWFKGDVAERYGATWLLAINLASDTAIAFTFPYTPQLALFVLDLVMAVGLLVLAVKFSSVWLGAAMLLQSVALFFHALRLAHMGLSSDHWMIFNNVITQLMQLCVVIASAISWASRRTPKAPAFYTVGDIAHV